jgi:hypothetical protein
MAVLAERVSQTPDLPGSLRRQRWAGIELGSSRAVADALP